MHLLKSVRWPFAPDTYIALSELVQQQALLHKSLHERSTICCGDPDSFFIFLQKCRACSVPIQDQTGKLTSCGYLSHLESPTIEMQLFIAVRSIADQLAAGVGVLVRTASDLCVQAVDGRREIAGHQCRDICRSHTIVTGHACRRYLSGCGSVPAR